MYERLQAIRCNNSSAELVRALPWNHYSDPVIYELEKNRIFYRSWICLGHVCMARETGDYFTGKVADQEILIVRGEDAQLRAFYNVCQHRGHFIKEGQGHCRRLVCPYHAWTYSLEGDLIAAPNANNVPGFDRSKIRLRAVRLEVLAGAVFVNLDSSAPALSSVFAGIEEEILTFHPRVADQKLVYDNPLPHDCNWKASVENFSECYHCAPVHKYLTANIIDPASYRVSAEGLLQRHVVEGRNGLITQRLWHFWPNTAMGIYPVPNIGQVWCIRHMYPVDPAHAIYHYRWFADPDTPDELVRAYAEDHAKTTGAEDGAVVAGVQRGIGSFGFEQGYLLADPRHGVSSEHVIGHFHALIRSALAEPNLALESE